jgi:drug/metabolite transporter (DMT)-like permease
MGSSDVPNANGTHPIDSVHRAAVMLVLTTLVWGLSFPLVKDWHEAATDCPGGALVAGSTLIALRMVLGLALLAAFRPRLISAASRREHLAGALVGAALAVGLVFQQVGLAFTTPANSAFFTSLCGAWVPVLLLVFCRQLAPPLTLLGIAVAAAGAGVLGIDPSDWSLHFGEVLGLICSACFGVPILLLDRFGRAIDPSHITGSLFAVTGVPALLLAVVLAGGPASWGSWLLSMLALPWLAVNVAVQVILCTVLAFHWMNTYQPRLSASRAGLIYFLEPVFGSIFSVIWGHDQITRNLLLGGALILGGNLLVELPGLRRQPDSFGATKDGVP